MEAMRQSWTDDQMDDLNGKVDGLGLEVRAEFKALRGEMKAGFDRIDERFERMEERFDQRLDSLNHVLILFSGGVCTALIALIATQL
jgi:hypothetical protein